MSRAGWYRDPSGRHEHRYFDGETWTEHVAGFGVQTRDVADAGWPPPPPGVIAGGEVVRRVRWFRSRGFVVAAVCLIVASIGGAVFAAASSKPSAKADAVTTTAAPTATVAPTTTTVKPKPKPPTGPEKVLAWFKLHRDDYRNLSTVIRNVSPEVSSAISAGSGMSLTSVCDAILPAAGNLQLDLPTGAQIVDSKISAALKLIRDGAVSCSQVGLDIQAQNNAFGADYQRMLNQLSGSLLNIEDALSAFGIPRDVL